MGLAIRPVIVFDLIFKGFQLLELVVSLLLPCRELAKDSLVFILLILHIPFSVGMVVKLAHSFMLIDVVHVHLWFHWLPSHSLPTMGRLSHLVASEPTAHWPIVFRIRLLDVKKPIHNRPSLGVILVLMLIKFRIIKSLHLVLLV